MKPKDVKEKVLEELEQLEKAFIIDSMPETENKELLEQLVIARKLLSENKEIREELLRRTLKDKVRILKVIDEIKKKIKEERGR